MLEWRALKWPQQCDYFSIPDFVLRDFIFISSQEMCVSPALLHWHTSLWGLQELDFEIKKTTLIIFYENNIYFLWFYLYQECQKRLDHKLSLDAYLLKPVQRITKYQLMLKVTLTPLDFVKPPVVWFWAELTWVQIFIYHKWGFLLRICLVLYRCCCALLFFKCYRWKNFISTQLPTYLLKSHFPFYLN